MVGPSSTVTLLGHAGGIRYGVGEPNPNSTAPEQYRSDHMEEKPPTHPVFYRVGCESFALALHSPFGAPSVTLTGGRGGDIAGKVDRCVSRSRLIRCWKAVFVDVDKNATRSDLYFVAFEKPRRRRFLRICAPQCEPVLVRMFHVRAYNMFSLVPHAHRVKGEFKWNAWLSEHSSGADEALMFESDVNAVDSMFSRLAL